MLSRHYTGQVSQVVWTGLPLIYQCLFIFGYDFEVIKGDSDFLLLREDLSI